MKWLAGAALVGGAAWYAGAFDGLGERVANVSAGLGFKRDDETAIYYARHLLPRVVKSPAAVDQLVARLRRAGESRIRLFGEQLAEQIRQLPDAPSDEQRAKALQAAAVAAGVSVGI